MPAALACQARIVHGVCAPAVRHGRHRQHPSQRPVNPRQGTGTHDALWVGMADPIIRSYVIDARWRIVQASEAFCRTLHSAESSLIGRDVRELLRPDWRADFRHYVARALVGVGDLDATIPLVSPSGEEGWFKHLLEPLIVAGELAGYRATIEPHAVTSTAANSKRWWAWPRGAAPQGWDTASGPFAKAS